MISSIPHLVFLLYISVNFRPLNGLQENLFPENFMFGVGSSAYQTEDSWIDDERGINIWDYYITRLSKNHTDISNQSYRRFKDDVALIANMKLKFYKFSLSWSRILPSAFNDSVNEKGITYYKNLIQELESQNITPIVTIYHWDLPQPLQELGGWTNSSMVQYFVDYARVVFQNFRTVKYWLTMHEPKQICRGGYGDGSLAPFLKGSGVYDYKCAYVVLKAHAAVYRMYRSEFADLGGKISIALDGSWSIPLTASDRTAANRRNNFEFGLYADPIFRRNGNWPNTVIQIVNKGNNSSEYRLPTLTREEIREIRGTADFLALNYYDARMVQNSPRLNSTDPSYEKDIHLNISKNSTWPEGTNGSPIVPWSIRNFLNWVKTEYRNPEIIITGNGVADDGSLQDTIRTSYMKEHISNILDAIHIDGVNVTGYIFWSLLDGFEWTDGYNIHCGLYSVDRNSVNRTRIAKDSSKLYREIATTLIELPISTDAPTSSTPVTDFAKTEATTSSGSNTTILLYSYILLVVSIIVLLFFSNGLFIISSFSKSFVKTV